MYHKGKEQPKLKGTLPPTKVQPVKRKKRRSKEQILLDRQKRRNGSEKSCTETEGFHKS